MTEISPISTDQRRFNQYSETIIGCGFVENIYANALAKEVQRQKLDARREFPVKVHYKEELVGEFFCDLLVERSIIVEVKATSGLNNLHMAQCLNYLKATGFKLCLLINFGAASVQVKRVVNNF